jgi:8-oxo-dGTP pyrophosphatase MutT (NUDIX family)
MKKERYKVIPIALLLLVVDGKILLSRRFNTGFEDGNYGLPAGHGEEGETMREGMVREAKEEIGIEIKPEDLDLALMQHQFCDDPGNPHARANFFFTARKWQGVPTNMEPNECDDVSWFPLDALPVNIIGHVRNAIETFRQGKNYVEYDWEKRK